ncbi:MAG: 30S ribosomal protein S12 methylthiotransferase RimO [Phycisphaeraceae bacterium]|nr:30S ribosomal protein S12 methylthiotransferase RimO [Phycisphaerae bacterium]MBX3392388.1 30S ribosomal protein S12 methylthiotransferase RimO [Phycisphaeraceae bacterium]
MAARARRTRTGPSRSVSPVDPGVCSVSFVSLGCPKNLVDSEKMLGLLAEDGILPVSYNPTEGDGFGGADAVVVNTCGFLEASKEESLGVIHEAIRAKQEGRVKRVVVAGCLVQRHRAKMLDWAPGIDAMIGVFDRDRIVDAVRGTGAPRARPPGAGSVDATPAYWIAGNALSAARDRGMKTTGLTVHGKDGKGLGYFEDDSSRLRLTPRHYAYLRISEGCNQNCAFCTIPSIRGKMRSKSPEAVVRETRELIADGAFEIMLIGQDTTSYGDDIGSGLWASPGKGSLAGGLPMLLRRVSDAMEDEGSRGWMRLMYAYPSNFSVEIVEAFAGLVKSGRLLPYIDIPLQHASDRVLGLMRRNVEARRQEDLMHLLREKVPGMAIRTTFISGFPGETGQDHEQLLGFVERMKFEAVGVFEYSHEDGTVAGTMENDPALAVAPEVKSHRRGEVMALQQKIAFERSARIAAEFDPSQPATTGRRLDVLIDSVTGSDARPTAGVSRGGRLHVGRAYFQAPQIDSVTYVQSRDKLSPGELVRCVVVASDGYDLIARPVAEVEKQVSLTVIRSGGAGPG